MPTQKYEMDLRNIAYKKFEKEPKKVIELSDYSKRDDINFAHIDSYIHVPTAPSCGDYISQLVCY
jgi:hypothetical protein